MGKIFDYFYSILFTKSCSRYIKNLQFIAKSDTFHECVYVDVCNQKRLQVHLTHILF